MALNIRSIDDYRGNKRNCGECGRKTRHAAVKRPSTERISVEFSLNIELTHWILFGLPNWMRFPTGNRISDGMEFVFRRRVPNRLRPGRVRPISDVTGNANDLVKG